MLWMWLALGWVGSIGAAGVAGFWWGRRPPVVAPSTAEPSQEEALDPLSLRARVLTAEVEVQGGSGEYKRHQVYARLIKEFPNVPKRQLARAIEDQLPGEVAVLTRGVR